MDIKIGSSLRQPCPEDRFRARRCSPIVSDEGGIPNARLREVKNWRIIASASYSGRKTCKHWSHRGHAGSSAPGRCRTTVDVCGCAARGQALKHRIHQQDVRLGIIGDDGISRSLGYSGADTNDEISFLRLSNLHRNVPSAADYGSNPLSM